MAKLSRRDGGALVILKVVLIGEDGCSLLILVGMYCTLSAIVASDSLASASLKNLLLSF